MTRNLTFITRERAKLRGYSSHDVDSGVVHFWKSSIEGFLHHIRHQKASS